MTISVVRAAHPLEPCSLLADRHPLSARVLEACELISIPTKRIIEVLSHDAGFAHAFVCELAKQSLEIIDDFKKYRLLNSTARIARWMLDCDGQSGETGQIEIPFDKRVLASYLGMTPEQLSRGFATLASSGLVKVDGRIVSIHDASLLARIAHREATADRPLAHVPPYRTWRERGQRL